MFTDVDHDEYQYFRIARCVAMVGLASVGTIMCHGAFAQTLPQPPVSPKIDVNGIDVQTGNETWSLPELSIGPDGIMGLQLTRSKGGGVVRDTFTNQYDYTQDVQSATFGQYSSALGYGAYPDYTQPAQTYTASDGSVVVFNILKQRMYNAMTGYYDSESWLASSITYPNGIRWDLHYKVIPCCGGISNDTRLQSVTSNTGFQIKFLYGTNDIGSGNQNSGLWKQRVGAIAINNAIEYCDPDADSCSLSQIWPQVSYGYNYNPPGGGLVETITNSLTGTAQFSTHFSNSYPYGPTDEEIKWPGSSTIDVTYYYTDFMGTQCADANADLCQYGNRARVSAVVTADKTTSYSYAESAGRFIITATEPDATSNVYEMPITWPTGGGWGVNPVMGILKWTNRDGYYMTFTNNVRGQPTLASWYEGNSTEFNRSETDCGGVVSQIAHPKMTGPSISASATFVSYGLNYKLCGKPATVTDARGNTTTYTYDGAHGGVLTELGPVNGSAPRAAKKYYYTQRYALTKSASGAFVASSYPVWLLSEVRSCKNSALDLSAGTCSGNDLIRTLYDYGPTSGAGNNLLLRGEVVEADGQSLRTCYDYDIYGRRMTKTKPRAGRTSCW